MIKESPPSLHQRIAGRVREARASSGLSLESLARTSGVSRSMISLIERGESSPTAVVLEKLASGLGVTLASLFDAPETVAAATPVSRREDQTQWRDPGSGYLRRNVSPGGAPHPLRIVEVQFPAGARVAFESGARDLPTHQQVWLLEGTINVTSGTVQHQLRAGDCLAMQLDQPTMFHNPSSTPARYAVVIANGSQARR